MSVTARETNKTYWRSLERLIESPAVRDHLADEFPERVTVPPDGVSRRTTLKLLGASFALAGLVHCRRPEETIVPLVTAPEDQVPGIPRMYATTMPLGTNSYGILVESHEGRPTKIEGNNAHPSSHGVASAWMQAAILDFYDPDRSSKVLRRAEGRGRFEESTWEHFADFWAEISPEITESGGEGLAVITTGYASPTIDRLAGRFREEFPKSRWVVHEPVSDENVFEGIRLATGKACRPLHHIDKAKTILAIDSDFLLTESEAIGNTRGYATSRKVRHRRDEMSRLYAVESVLSLTGSNADHRLRLPSHKIPAFVAALALELETQGLSFPSPLEVSPPDLPERTRKKLRILARELIHSRSEALVMAGRGQPPAVHALVFAVNQALGSLGHTLSLRELEDVGWGRAADLESLSADMRRGDISVLLLLGGNPAYNAPADLDFSNAIRQVDHSVHLSTYVNETSELVYWHLPEAHFLESWGDARAADGSASVIQPLVAPLFNGRSRAELIGLLIEKRDVNGYGLVRDTWIQSVLGSTNFDPRWNRAVHDGVLPDNALAPVRTTPDGGAIARAVRDCVELKSDSPELEIVFTVSSAVYDGRFANNGWLQELSDPVTKLTWDNAALVSPATARELDVESGTVVRLEVRGRRVEAPVLVLPGQADESIALALGYGRSAAGRVGNGVGVNAYDLRVSGALHFGTGLRVEKTGRSYPLTQTQTHGEMEGRDIIRESTLAEYRDLQSFDRASEGGHQPPLLWQEHEYSEGNQWGMAIDLNACIGCNACVVACQSENNIPVVGKKQVEQGREMHWLRVDRYFSGDPEEPGVAFQPVPCMHCEDAPCEQVCPVGATVHDSEGLNTMVYNRCIGTRYCSNNCPYKVRHFNFFNYTKDLPELVQMAQNPDVTVRSRGVMEKCTYCVQRINESKKRADSEGRGVRDGEIQTACQQSCPADAIVFGNINDLKSSVSGLKGDDRNYVLLPELNVKPRTSYLTKLRNPNPEWGDDRLEGKS